MTCVENVAAMLSLRWKLQACCTPGYTAISGVKLVVNSKMGTEFGLMHTGFSQVVYDPQLNQLDISSYKSQT